MDALELGVDALKDKGNARNPAILTLEDAIASQKDLSQLCSDRPLRTNEIFQPNAYYGNDFILKKYAGLPQSYHLKVVIPHGVNYSDDYVWEAESVSLLPAVLCFSSHREIAYRNITGKVVVRSASPFLYVVEMLKGQAQPDRRGTIFFPVHSTHHMTFDMDFEAMAEELIHLDHEFQPVTICLYWRNFNLGHHRPFQRRGLPIVSAGHMYDPAFLLRFYHLCSLHRYSASNGLGSSLFYSVKSGCSYFHLDTVKYSVIAENHVLQRDTGLSSPNIGARLARRAALLSLFSTPQPCTTPDQMKMVNYYLGAEHLVSPGSLRRQLLYAEMLDKFGFLIHNRKGKVRFVVPSYYRRTHIRQTVKRKLSDLKRRVLRR